VLGSGVLVGSGVLDVLGSGVVDVVGSGVVDVVDSGVVVDEVGSGVVDVVGSDVNNLLPVGYGVELATASGSKLLLLVNVYFDVRLLNFEWFTLYCPSSQGNGIGQAGAKVGVGVDEIGSVMGVEVVVIGVAVESATVVDVKSLDDDVVVLPSRPPVVVEPAMAVEVVAAGVAVEFATVVDVNALDDDVVVLASSCPQMLGIHDRAIKTARVTTTDRVGRVRRSPGRDACTGRPVCMQFCGGPSRVSGHKLACLLRAAVEHHADARAITTSCAPR